MSRSRVAVGGFLHETNTFMPSRADLAHFEQAGGYPGLCFGAEVLRSVQGVNSGLAGFIDAARDEFELVPTVWAVAVPSGPVTTRAFETVASSILSSLEADRDLDAVYLDLHGAMVTEDWADGEGELLRRIRTALGPHRPIVASLDLHANVSPEMVAHSDMLISYRTYPHIDMAETGARCFAALRDMLVSGRRPDKALRQLDFLIPTIAQCTLGPPASEIFEALERLEGEPGVTSVSFNPAFPAADIPHCRPSILAYGSTQQQAEAAATELSALVNDAESDFAVPTYTPDDAVAEGLRVGRPGSPVVIADTQDNPGGGSTSDTMGMLRALLEARAPNAAIGLVADPEAAEAAHRAGVGSTIHVALGGRGGFAGDAPLEGEFLVEALSDGEVRMSGGLYGHGLGRLGASAGLRIGGVQVAVSSHVSQMADQEQFRFVGIEPRDKAILVVKSTIHYRANFDRLGGTTLFAISPGGMIADPAALEWRHLAPEVRRRPRTAVR